MKNLLLFILLLTIYTILLPIRIPVWIYEFCKKKLQQKMITRVIDYGKTQKA